MPSPPFARTLQAMQTKADPQLTTKRGRLKCSAARQIVERELYRDGYVPLKAKVQLFIGPHGHIKAVVAKPSAGRALGPLQLRQIRGLTQGAQALAWNPRDGFIPIADCDARANGRIYACRVSSPEE